MTQPAGKSSFFAKIGVFRGVALFVIAIVICVFWGYTKVLAISSITYGPSGSVVGTYVGASVNNFAIFTPVVALLSVSTIKLTFPSGTTLTSANIATSDFKISQASDGLLCVTAGSDTAPSAVS